MNKKYQQLGIPDLHMLALQVWVHGRECSNPIGDYWDDNWLLVTIHGGTKNSDVWIVNTAAIHLSDFISLRGWFQRLHDGIENELAFSFIEPYLSLSVKNQSAEKLDIIITLTPDMALENHEYIHSVEKSQLEAIFVELDEILRKYPIIGAS